jgi:hypothetical protein
MYCNQKGTVDVICKDGSRMTLTNVLYIPRLGVNLGSGRRIFEARLTGQFTKSHMYFKTGKNKIITATMQDGLYVITHIEQGYLDEALYGHGYHHTAFSGEIINGTNGTTNELTASENEKYLLGHLRFNHLGPDKITNLHKVTNLATSIKVPNNLDICEVCVLTKMTNRIPKQLSIHKSKRLELIHFGIASSFTQSFRGNHYFILIINRSTRVNWIILLKHKSDAILQMTTWKAEIELATGDKIIAARADNAPELIQAIHEWRSGTRLEVTTIASSHQNGAGKGISELPKPT